MQKVKSDFTNVLLIIAIIALTGFGLLYCLSGGGHSSINHQDRVEKEAIKQLPQNYLKTKAYYYDPYSGFSDNISSKTTLITSPFNLGRILSGNQYAAPGVTNSTYTLTNNFSNINLGMTARQVVIETDCSAWIVETYNSPRLKHLKSFKTPYHNAYLGTFGSMIVNRTDVETLGLTKQTLKLVNDLNHHCDNYRHGIIWTMEVKHGNYVNNYYVFFQPKNALYHRTYNWRVVGLAKLNRKRNSNQFDYHVKTLNHGHEWTKSGTFKDYGMNVNQGYVVK